MKRISTILLLLIIFLQSFSSFLIQAYYFLNKSYIASVLCINKEKPKMQCQGKCYLKKQLKEQEQKGQHDPTAKKEKFEVQAFFLPKQSGFEAIHFSTRVEYYPIENILHSGFLHSIFHPPTV